MANTKSSINEYVQKRCLSSSLVDDLQDAWLIKANTWSFTLAMKDLEWTIIGHQERFFTPISRSWKTVKSKTKAWSKVWYFFDEIDYDKPVIVTEGEIDFLTIGWVWNVIGLQGISNLKKLLLSLQEKWAVKICLLIDNDDASESAIQKCIEHDDIDSAIIYDSRKILWNYNDVNDFIVSWWVFDIDTIERNAVVLTDTIWESAVFRPVIDEISDSLDEDALRRIKQIISSLCNLTNFILLPRTVNTQRQENLVSWNEQEVFKEWSGDVYIINDSWCKLSDKFTITNRDITIAQDFKIRMSKKVWLHITRAPSEVLKLVKMLFDALQSSWNIAEYIQVWKLWYIQNNKRSIRYTNGELDVQTWKFTKKKFIVVSNPFRIEFDEKSIDDVSCKEHIQVFSSLSETLTEWTTKTVRFMIRYLTASIRKNEIMKNELTFPLINVHGIRWCGKSYLINIFAEVVWHKKNAVISANNTTKFSYLDQLSRLSYFIFIDELQWGSTFKSVVEVLKGNYDGRLATRWTRWSWWAKVNTYSNDSVLFVSWEALSSTESLLTRSIILELQQWDLKKMTRQERSEIIDTWKKHFMNSLSKKHEVDIDQYLQKAEKIVVEYNIQDIRLWKNLKVLIVWSLLCEPNMPRDELKQLLMEHVSEYKSVSTSETIAHNVVEDIISNTWEYFNLEKLVKNWNDPCIYIYNNRLILNFTGIYLKYSLRGRLSMNDKSYYEKQFFNLLWHNWNLRSQYRDYKLITGKAKQNFWFEKDKVIWNKYLTSIRNSCLSEAKRVLDNKSWILRDEAWARSLSRIVQDHQIIE